PPRTHSRPLHDALPILGRPALPTSTLSLDVVDEIADASAEPVLCEVLPARQRRETKLFDRLEGSGVARPPSAQHGMRESAVDPRSEEHTSELESRESLV